MAGWIRLLLYAFLCPSVFSDEFMDCPLACDHDGDDWKYHLYDHPVNAYQARTACKANGGRLINVNTDKLWDRVTSMLSRGGKIEIWIGGSDEWEEGRWVQEDHTVLEFTNWKKDPSEDKGKNCIKVNKKEKWEEEDCYQKNGFVCEYKVLVKKLYCPEVCYYQDDRVVFAYQYDLKNDEGATPCDWSFGKLVGNEEDQWQPLQDAIQKSKTARDMAFVIEFSATVDPYTGPSKLCYIVNDKTKVEVKCGEDEKGVACSYKRIDSIVNLYDELASGFMIPEDSIEVFGTCFVFLMDKKPIAFSMMFCDSFEGEIMGKYIGTEEIKYYTKKSLFLQVGNNKTLSEPDEYFIDLVRAGDNEICGSAVKAKGYKLGIPDCADELPSICKKPCCRVGPAEAPQGSVMTFEFHVYKYTCEESGWIFEDQNTNTIIGYCNKDGQWKFSHELKDCVPPPEGKT